MRIVSAAHPIVPNAKFTVWCPCGFAHESAEETADAALRDMEQRHNCGQPGLLGVREMEPR